MPSVEDDCGDVGVTTDAAVCPSRLCACLDGSSYMRDEDVKLRVVIVVAVVAMLVICVVVFSIPWMCFACGSNGRLGALTSCCHTIRPALQLRYIVIEIRK